MSETKIVVPEGMLDAAVDAAWKRAYPDKEFPAIACSSERVREDIRESFRVALEAALRWLSENPIVPTKQQVCETLNPVQVQSPSTFALFTEAWQRRMFLAPEPGPIVPEDEELEVCRDLLLDLDCETSTWERQLSNRRTIEAYRRGQKAGK